MGELKSVEMAPVFTKREMKLKHYLAHLFHRDKVLIDR